MLCKGVIQENNIVKNCWLPADTNSVFELCRRCHFDNITKVVDSLTFEYSHGCSHPQNESVLQNTSFLYELFHPAREQALLNLLSSLFHNKKDVFQDIVLKLKEKSAFSILLTNRILVHHPGTRCQLYRSFLKDTSLYKSEYLCWNCWECIVWSLQQKEKRFHDIFIEQYLFHISRINATTFHTIGSHVLKELFLALYLLGEYLSIEVIMRHLFHELDLTTFKYFLTTVFQQAHIAETIFQEKRNIFIPLPLQEDVVINQLQKNVKSFIKQRTDTFKEELMKRTWHPSRLFTWCFDLDDLTDFTDTQWNPVWLDE